MPTVRINDVNIYYESYGGGFPLILTYGFGGNTGMWANQIDAFSQQYRFIVWDPRGHGHSESPPSTEQYGMHLSVADLHGLMNQLSIKKACVGGLSMGGGIATRFAVAYPERVAALLIIDSTSVSGVPRTAARLSMMQKMIELAETQDMEAVANYAIENDPNFKTQAKASPEAHQRLRRKFLDMNPIGYANTMRTLPERIFPTEQLATLTMPTLVLVGEEDPALEAAKLTHDKIPDSRLVILSGAGHLSNLDCPEAFNNSILTFLRLIDF